VKRHRDLIVANIAGLVILLLALLAGWREAAGFGLAVLLVLNLVVFIRARQARTDSDRDE
jgi:hypothetical protein